MRVSRSAALVLASVLLGGAPALAADTAPATAPAPSVHIRGTVSAASPASITVTTASGPVVIALTDKTRVSGVVPGSLSDLTPGSYIGAVNAETNGSWRAVSINIFPPAARGTGLGDRPWEPGGSTTSAMTNGTVGGAASSSSMTNGTVAQAAAGTKKITLDYGSGTKTIEIPANVSIFRIVPATMDMVVPGAHVFVDAATADGKRTANRISVGQNGAIPN